MKSRKTFITVGAIIMVSAAMTSRFIAANYDEGKVPKYTLPDPLVMNDGAIVHDAEAWTGKRRPEIVALFEEHVYGKAPARPVGLTSKVLSVAEDALDGKATRKQIEVALTANPAGPKMDLLIYLPNKVKKPVPVFFGLNFRGNHTVHADPGIKLPAGWVPKDKGIGVEGHKASETSRGRLSHRWSIDVIIDKGYGLATAYCGDIEPDQKSNDQNGIRSAFYEEGRTAPRPGEWGSIAAWAFGMSRALDVLIDDPEIDGKRVAAFGFSRLGKTALWAGALDERFAMVISNNSGCGGAALSRREFGETVKRINTSFPHWFCGNFKKYNDRINECPVDQHMLIALVAPRPVYIASAAQDRWADPYGEFLSGKGADPVYRLLGLDGLAAESMPEIHAPIHSRIGYHIRAGKHSVTDYDWVQYTTFGDKHMK